MYPCTPEQGWARGGGVTGSLFEMRRMTTESFHEQATVTAGEREPGQGVWDSRPPKAWPSNLSTHSARSGGQSRNTSGGSL